MTTQQLEGVLASAALCIVGGPVLVLHAFFYRPERLVLKKRARVLFHVLSACIFMVLSGMFIHLSLPAWHWLQWVNFAAFALALLASARRLRVWLICAYHDEWHAVSLGTVMQVMFDRLHYNLTLERSGAVMLRLTILSIPEVTRVFKLTELTADEFLIQMIAVFNNIPNTVVNRLDHGEINSINTVRINRTSVMVTVR